MRETAEVVSGPHKKMTMAAEQRSDMEKELTEIRKEVIEARNLVIKNDNLLKNLHAELKNVAKWQETVQKRQILSSGVAYALFALLCIGAAVAVSSARTASATGERERLEKQVAELSTTLEKSRADQAVHVQAQRQAADVYNMMTNATGDDRLKGIDALVKLDTSKLSPLERQLLNDRASALRKEVGDTAFERGKTAFRRNEHGNAVSELSRFLAMNPPEAEALDASFFLGVSHNQLRQHDKAAPLLARFVQKDTRSKQRDYAMLLLAQSYLETNQLEKAAETAREALATYPASDFAPQLRGRLAAAKRMMAGGPADAPVPTVSQPPAGPTAQQQ